MEIKDLRKQYLRLEKEHFDIISDFNIVSSVVLDIAISGLTPFVEVDEKRVAKIRKILDKHIKKDIPIEKFLGYKLFMDCYFPYSRNTLTPRQDTELLVEKVLGYLGKKELKVLDLCSGSGCIGISIAKYSNSQVVCADISNKALKEIKSNAKLNRVNVEVLKTDMFSNLNERYDVIVCNPPYIPKIEYDKLDNVVKKHDPKLALLAKDDGYQFYIQIAKKVKEFLNKNGRLFLEIGYSQGEKVKDLLKEKFDVVEVLKDYSGNDRIVICYDKENKKGE